MSRIQTSLPLLALTLLTGCDAVSSMFKRGPALGELRAEVPNNVDAIAIAERAYIEALGEVIPQTTPYPRALEALDATPVAWSFGSRFDELGWAPPTDIRGSYSVEVSADGKDFVVHGYIDADHDGKPAHYTATRADNATPVTSADIY